MALFVGSLVDVCVKRRCSDNRTVDDRMAMILFNRRWKMVVTGMRVIIY